MRWYTNSGTSLASGLVSRTDSGPNLEFDFTDKVIQAARLNTSGHVICGDTVWATVGDGVYASRFKLINANPALGFIADGHHDPQGTWNFNSRSDLQYVSDPNVPLFNTFVHRPCLAFKFNDDEIMRLDPLESDQQCTVSGQLQCTSIRMVEGTTNAEFRICTGVDATDNEPYIAFESQGIEVMRFKKIVPDVGLVLGRSAVEIRDRHLNWQNVYHVNIGYGLYWTPSDDRLKHNEAPLVGGVDVVKQLEPQTYDQTETFDADPSTGVPQVGLIAQEVEAITGLEGLVSEIDGVKRLNYLGVMMHMLVALKELTARVEALESA